jgi:hypothetical protein
MDPVVASALCAPYEDERVQSAGLLTYNRGTDEAQRSVLKRAVRLCIVLAKSRLRRRPGLKGKGEMIDNKKSTDPGLSASERKTPRATKGSIAFFVAEARPLDTVGFSQWWARSR